MALAVPALLPPPFPLTPFVLTCGALNVNPWWFFPTFGLMRFLRFSASAVVALHYGPGILRLLKSQTFQVALVALAGLVILVSTLAAVALWRRTHPRALNGT